MEQKVQHFATIYRIESAYTKHKLEKQQETQITALLRFLQVMALQHILSNLTKKEKKNKCL